MLQKGFDYKNNEPISNKVFLERMRKKAKSIIRRRGSVTNDDLQEFASKLSWKVPSSWWGAVFRASYFEKIGAVPSHRKVNKGRYLVVWRKA